MLVYIRMLIYPTWLYSTTFGATRVAQGGGRAGPPPAGVFRQTVIAKQRYNWYPEPIFAAIYTVFRVRAYGDGFGDDFGQKSSDKFKMVCLYIRRDCTGLATTNFGATRVAQGGGPGRSPTPWGVPIYGCRETALDLIFGADFWCNLRSFSSRS